jgi:hypothetical protein
MLPGKWRRAPDDSRFSRWIEMTDPSVSLPAPSSITGKSARFAAALFNWGNIAAMLVPIPVGLLWVCASMIIYAMNRHHPNPRVGHYTQQAAYRFYGVTGFFVAIGAFFPGNSHKPYLVAWALAAAVIIPWSVLDLIRIRREAWADTVVAAEPSAQPEAEQ